MGSAVSHDLCGGCHSALVWSHDLCGGFDFPHSGAVGGSTSVHVGGRPPVVLGVWLCNREISQCCKREVVQPHLHRRL